MTAPDTEKLAKTCAADAPGTAIDRWRALCPTGLLAQLRANGRDVTVIVGRRTDRKSGDFAVVLEGERN